MEGKAKKCPNCGKVDGNVRKCNECNTLICRKCVAIYSLGGLWVCPHCAGGVADKIFYGRRIKGYKKTEVSTFDGRITGLYIDNTI